MKNKQSLRICIKIIAIIGFLSVLLVSYAQNYDANKRFDEYFSLEYYQLGYSKGFNFSDEARASPIFYWEWDCAPTKSQEFYYCNHIQNIPFIGKEKSYVFKLYILSEQDLIKKKDLWIQRQKINKYIVMFSIWLIVLLISFNRWQYKNDYKEWERTPIAGIIKKLKRFDHVD